MRPQVRPGSGAVPAPRQESERTVDGERAEPRWLPRLRPAGALGRARGRTHPRAQGPPGAATSRRSSAPPGRCSSRSSAVLIFTVIFGRVARSADRRHPLPGVRLRGPRCLALLRIRGVGERLRASSTTVISSRRSISHAARADCRDGARPRRSRDLAAVHRAFMLVWSVVPGSEDAPAARSGCSPRCSRPSAVGLLLAGLNVRYRDVRFALPFLLQVWLFASPVVYTVSAVEGAWRYVYALNPHGDHRHRLPLVARRRPAPGPEALVSAVVVRLPPRSAASSTSVVSSARSRTSSDGRLRDPGRGT